jgi:hypothetical protein
MPSTPLFPVLLVQLLCRDNRAAAAVFHRFRSRLMGLARQPLYGRLCGK